MIMPPAAPLTPEGGPLSHTHIVADIAKLDCHGGTEKHGGKIEELL